MQITAPLQTVVPSSLSWLKTAAVYATAFALIAVLAFLGVDETRALLLG